MGEALVVDFAFVLTSARYIASFFAYAFAGWLFEVVISLFQHHRFVNRGFSFGPVCPIYGVGALLSILCLAPFNDPLVQFVVGFFAAGVLEFGTSWAMERLFHARWWDYSNIPLNVNGRICVPGLLLFSSLMLCVDLFFQPALDTAFALVPAQVFVVATMVMSLVFAVDLTASVIRMQGFAEKMHAAQAAISSLPARAVEAMRSVAPNVGDLKDDVLENIRQLAGPQALAEYLGRMRDIARGGWSSYERKSMADPRFRFTQDRDAFEWARRVMPYLKKASSEMVDTLSDAASKAVGRVQAGAEAVRGQAPDQRESEDKPARDEHGTPDGRRVN